jgi:hypothetical protein
VIIQQRFRLSRDSFGPGEYHELLNEFTAVGLEPLLLSNGNIAGFASNLSLVEFIERAVPLLKKHRANIAPGSIIKWKDTDNEWMTVFRDGRVLTMVTTNRHRQGVIT